MSFISFNGQLIPAQEPVLTVQNRAFKWGDGLFETIKVRKGTILLSDLHFERLYSGLKLLEIDASLLSREELSLKIVQLCTENNCDEKARVRLTVYRSEEGSAQYIIEAVPLSADADAWNERGWKIDIYPFIRKSQDAFSSLKSSNFLPYVMAARYAEAEGMDDAIVLNNEGRIADTSKANIFLFRKQTISTPAINQGCVLGVMRRYLIEQLKKQGYSVRQEEITETELLEADEVFLTNAIMGIRWVASFRNKMYACEKSHHIYQEHVNIEHRTRNTE